MDIFGTFVDIFDNFRHFGIFWHTLIFESFWDLIPHIDQVLFLNFSTTKMDMLSGQQLLRKTGEVVKADEVLSDKKILAYYFSAHWCPPCRNFTPILSDFYTVKSRCLKITPKKVSLNYADNFWRENSNSSNIFHCC